MVATPARIAFVMEEWRRAVSTTPIVKERHGELARESEDPIEAAFDNVEDAQAVADARQALLSSERRRFSVTVNRLEDAIALEYLDGLIPTARLIDRNKAADLPVLVVEIGYDFAAQRAVFGCWG